MPSATTPSARLPRLRGPLPFETLHLTELLAEKAHWDLLPPSQNWSPIMILAGWPLPPRPRTAARGALCVPELQLVEMEDNRERTMCCGSTAWVNCSGCSKLIQREKLRQARETGAQIMLTTCPKCQIHLRCASRDWTPIRQCSGGRDKLGRPGAHLRRDRVTEVGEIIDVGRLDPGSGLKSWLNPAAAIHALLLVWHVCGWLPGGRDDRQVQSPAHHPHGTPGDAPRGPFQ